MNWVTGKRAAWGWIFFAAIVARVAVILVLDTPGGIEGKQPWEWGCEQACIADAIYRGDGYADPFGRNSPATAWLTPVYPALLAALMWLFGGMTVPMAATLFLIQALVSALTAVGLKSVGDALGRPRLGVFSAWIWALHPVAVWYSAGQIWDTSLVAGGVVLLMLWLLRSGRECRTSTAAQVGAFFGFLQLTSPAVIGISPAVFFYLGSRAHWRQGIRRCIAFVVGTVLVCLPWMYRNYQALGTASLRSNLMVEMRVGNNEVADGWHQKSLHPGWAPAEAALLDELGEIEYAERCEELVSDWIADNPAEFLRLSCVRMTLIWLGAPPTLDPRSQGGVQASHDPRSWIRWIVFLLTGVFGAYGLVRLGRRTTGGQLLLGCAVFFTFPYYIVHALERYRFPVEPLLVLGCGEVLSRILKRRKARRQAQLENEAGESAAPERTRPGPE